MASLAGAQLKLARAQRHVEDLRSAIQAHFQSNPYRINKREDPTGDLVYTVEILEQLPPDLGAVVGDAVHNIRSVLELLTWQLVRANGGHPNKDTSFPICRTQASFDQTAQRCLAGASIRAVRFVKRLKPWPGGNETLVQLHMLDIVDKHRVILVVGSAYRHVVLKIQVPWRQESVPFPPLALNPADRHFPLVQGAELFRVKAAARSGLKIDEPVFVFEPCFGEEADVSGLPLIPTLERLHKHVFRIVQLADNFLV